MPLADYDHYNEDARMVWWQEEGRYDGGYEDSYLDSPYEEDWPDFR